MPEQASVAAVDYSRRITRIWAWYRRHRSLRLRDVLVDYYTDLVKRHARNVRANLPASVRVEELEAAGMLGLLDCIDTFDPAKATFETFSVRRIRGAMRDELRGMDWAPRSMRVWQKKVAEAERAAEIELGRPPSDHELACRLGIGRAKLKTVLRDTRATNIVSLSAERRGADRRELLAGPIADDRAADPAREAQRTVLRDEITRGLSRAERLIIILCYFEGLSLKEIGRVLDLSESRISQMRTSILARLRARLEECDLLAA